MEKMRLQKWMANCGVASRRGSEELIAAGRVRVNDRVVDAQGILIDPAHDVVKVDGRLIEPRAHKLYYLYYKPAGLLTTVADSHGRETIFDALPRLRGQVVPVGRLDKDTEGLLLLTNDGELHHRLIHPSFGVNKIYRAEVRGAVSKETLQQLREGVLLEDGRTAPAQVKRLKGDKKTTVIQLTLHEGKKREVRRMCAAVGHPVVRLTRIVFAGLTIGDLKKGEFRTLKKKEIQRLKQMVRLTED